MYLVGRLDGYTIDDVKGLIDRGRSPSRQGVVVLDGKFELNESVGNKWLKGAADALKKLMMLYGASEIQVETVSFGKEKPRREGHDETAWAENRRDEIVYVGE